MCLGTGREVPPSPVRLAGARQDTGMAQTPHPVLPPPFQVVSLAGSGETLREAHGLLGSPASNVSSICQPVLLLLGMVVPQRYCSSRTQLLAWPGSYVGMLLRFPLQVFEACRQELPWGPLYSSQQFPMGERFSSWKASSFLCSLLSILTTGSGVTDTKIDCLPQRSKGSKAREP